MKKLMFAVAAVAAGVAVADVTSANVVGYVNDGVPRNVARIVCSQFQKIGVEAADMTLGDLVPGGKWRMGRTDKIKVFKASGAVDFQAVYVDAATATALAGDLGRTPDVGWYKDTDTSYTTCINSSLVPYGTGVLAASGQKDAYITSSGEVVESETGKIRFNIARNVATIIGNCTPVELTLGNFVPAGGWRMGRTDKIKAFKASGAVDFQAVYIDAATAEALSGDLGRTPAVGWYKDTDTSYTTCINSTQVLPGYGFLAATGQKNSYIEIPSAL